MVSQRMNSRYVGVIVCFSVLYWKDIVFCRTGQLGLVACITVYSLCIHSCSLMLFSFWSSAIASSRVFCRFSSISFSFFRRSSSIFPCNLLTFSARFSNRSFFRRRLFFADSRFRANLRNLFSLDSAGCAVATVAAATADIMW